MNIVQKGEWMRTYEVLKPKTLEDVIAIIDLMAITLEEGHPFVSEHPHLVVERPTPFGDENNNGEMEELMERLSDGM